MNALIEDNYITKMVCGSNFAYILNDNDIFLSTEYKVLQSQTGSCFVKCKKMLYNGKVQLYYITKSFKQFASMIPSLDDKSFLIIVENLFKDIINVKNNGFLSCRNIDISFERIYVSPSTYKVWLVYLPLSKRIYEDNASFENEVRTGLVKLISRTDSLLSVKTKRFLQDLSDGTLTLEELYNRIKGSKPEADKPRESGLSISSMNAPDKIVIRVTKDEFVIGRKDDADAVIAFNRMIGRHHCKIIKKGTRYTITDLNSKNGTFVNNERLHSNQPFLIRDGDIIRLANSDFKVRIEQER